MSVKLRCVSALFLTIAGGHWFGARPAAAEEVGDGALEAVAYDVIIVPREGRTSRNEDVAISRR
jgi:hypothetical protein